MYHVSKTIKLERDMNRPLLLRVVSPIPSQLFHLTGAFSISKWHSPGSQCTLYSVASSWGANCPGVILAVWTRKAAGVFLPPSYLLIVLLGESWERNSQAGPVLAPGQYLSMLNAPVQKITLAERAWVLKMLTFFPAKWEYRGRPFLIPRSWTRIYSSWKQTGRWVFFLA